MKTPGLKKTVLLLMMFIGGMHVNAQQLDAQVPGDNFSLEGALELFKKSASPEDFEKKINSADSKVNNLDLNGDGYIDYIRVIDRNEGNVHAFILQALISDSESQDVAVIELEKLADGKAVLQITGDADVYGVETIIEPTEEVRVYAGTTTARTVVNVWTWPSVQYVYSPYYTAVWISPWRWSYRPYWYRPWRPVAYYVYSPWWRPYHVHYAVCYSHRVTYAYNLYRPYRTTSVIVHNRHHDRIVAYRSTRHDYDRNGRYKYHDNGSRSSRSESRYSDHRPGDRKYDVGRDRSTKGRTESRDHYSDRTSRQASADRRGTQPVRNDFTKRDYSRTSHEQKSDGTFNHRSSTPPVRATDSQTRSRNMSKPSGNWSPSRNTGTSRSVSSGEQRQPSSRSFSGESRQRPSSGNVIKPASRPASAPVRSAPAGNSSRSRSESSGKSKRGGN